jgi:hypothetical protein
VNGWIVLGVIVGLAILAVVGSKLGWTDFSNKIRRSGTSGGGFGVIDEIYNPSQYEAQLEMDRQTIVPAPAPVAGDGDKGVPDAAPGQYGGRMSIDLGKNRRRP